MVRAAKDSASTLMEQPKSYDLKLKTPWRSSESVYSVIIDKDKKTTPMINAIL